MDTIIQSVLDGGWKSLSVAFILLGMSVISVGSMIAEGARLWSEIKLLPAPGAAPVAGSSWQKVFAAAREDLGLPSSIQERRIKLEVEEIASRGAGTSTVLATIGSNAPYIGLFGTVLGVYGALHALSFSFGMAPTMREIASPVGEALVMTALGLIVAVPAVFGYNLIAYLRHRHLRLLQAYAIISRRPDGASLRELERAHAKIHRFKKA